jgi:hypothetical protein
MRKIHLKLIAKSTVFEEDCYPKWGTKLLSQMGYKVVIPNGITKKYQTKNSPVIKIGEFKFPFSLNKAKDYNSFQYRCTL